MRQFQSEFPVAPNLPPARKSAPGADARNWADVERGSARFDGQAEPQPNGPWSGPEGEERSDE